MSGNQECPRLRHVDLRPSGRHPATFDILDPSGISTSVLTVSGITAHVLCQMDGRRSRADIQADFMRQFGHMLYSDDLDRLIEQIDRARLLEGESFDRHVAELTRRYRVAPARPLRDEASLGAPVGQLASYFDSLLEGPELEDSASDRRILGIIAPHLDYPRGAPCYSAAYGRLARQREATRFVILGTNHFGRAGSVVGTRQAFATPFGAVPCDRELLARLEQRCGSDLCDGEYDHVREHSIELQVLLLKHIFADRPIAIVPFLCPDPCERSRSDTENGSARLRFFAEALGEALDDDPSICLIAGADLSHVGRYFRDMRPLDVENLAAVESSDRTALAHVEASNPGSFLTCIANASNATNICSVGCIYALSTALKGRAKPRLLRYHQAVTPEAENCVTCAAVEFKECG